MSYLNLRILGAQVVPVTDDFFGSVALHSAETDSPDCGFLVLPLQNGLYGSDNQHQLLSLSRGDLLVFPGKRTGYLSTTLIPPLGSLNGAPGSACADAQNPSKSPSDNVIGVDQLTNTVGVTSDQLRAIILKVQLCEIVKGGVGDFLPDSLLLTPPASRRSYIISIGEQLAIIANNSEDINKAKVVRFTELLLIEALDLFLNQDSETSRLMASGKNPRIGEAIRAVHDNPAQNWTVSGLAAVANMSRSLFAIRFKETYGETPLSYVRQCRIHRAKLLLTESVAPLDQIADQCGYTSQSAFIKAFSAAIGYSPGRWRNLQKGK